MDATELGRWSRFAAKGGIGKCTALQDYVAEEPEDLMFMKDDEITVLMQLGEQEDLFLGYCEGVIGRFRASYVRFHGRLKKPVMTKRASSGHSISPRSRSQSRPSSSQSAVTLAARDVVSPPYPFQGSPAVSRASSPRMSVGTSASGSIATEMPSPGSAGRLAQSGSRGSVRAPSPLRTVRSAGDGDDAPHAHVPERSASHSSSRSATLETAPPATPATSPEEEEFTVRIAVHSRDHPEQLSPVVRESVLFPEDEEALTPGPATTPLNIRKTPSALGIRQELERSPHTPASPVRSETSPDASPRSFSYGVDDTEDSSRLSLDMSAGVEGIGLSLLQGFVSGGARGDDDASVLSSRSGADTPSREIAQRQSTASTVNDDSRSPADSPRSASQSVSQYSRSPSPIAASSETEEFHPHPPNPPYARDSHRSSVQSVKSARSLQSLRPSLVGSEHSGGSGSGSGWEGDIYDDYRYSRFSMASKVSRLSAGSIKPLGEIPPVPSEHLPAKLSLENGLRIVQDEANAGLRPPAAVVVSSESGTITNGVSVEGEREAFERGSALSEKDRPPPLSFRDPDGALRHSATSTAQTVSPLLHGSFGSPTQSTTPKTPASPNTQAFMDSSAPGSPEQQSFSGLSPPRSADVRRASGQAIIVEDDEELPFPSGPASPTSPREQSSFAHAKAREAAERAMSPSNEPAPPPPYAMPGPSARPMYAALSPPPAQGPPLLRTRSTNQPPADPSARTSLFMPHPHAPKPAQVPAGPMYGRQPAPFAPPQQYHGPPPGSVIHTIHTLLQQQQQGRRPGGSSTIYARFDRDLANSIGPVPISFTLEPQMNIPANRPVGYDMYNQGPGSRAGSPSAAPSRVATPMDPSPYDVAATMAQGSSLSRAATASPAVGGMGRTASPVVGSHLARAATASPRPVNAPPPAQGEFGRPDSASSSKAIPRPNFFPKAGTPRPRSRSFSGFDSPSSAEVILPIGDGTKDGPSSAQLSSVALITKRSKSATATPVAAASPLVPSPQRATLSHTSSVVRGVQRPSPLSLSQNNTVAGRSSPASLNVPFAGRPMLIPAASSAPNSPVSRAIFDRNGTLSPPQQRDVPTGGSSVRHQSTATLKSEHSASPSSPPSSPRSPASTRSSFPVIRHSRSSILPGTKTAQGEPALPPSPRAPAAPGRPSIESSNTPPPRPSVESSASRQSTDSTGLRRPSQLSVAMKVSSPSPDPSESGLSVNAPSLRSKASSGLRVQTLGERPLLPSNERSPASSVFSFDNPTEQKVHVSVKDMDFELVAPSGPRSPVATSSADSLLVPGANVDAKSDASSLSLKRPLTAKSGGGDKVPKVTDAAEVEAHRQRELRWISALSSTTPSQARKTKRIRKLVLEGVPASVRYRVWAHLTDSEAKRMKGLYAQLDQRERVAAIANIEQDAQRIFRDQPLLDQSLVNVLQAYLTMVPDVQYTKGLAMIAGQLVLQSPEEDAFWTFVTLMDSHIRPYFSPQQALLEIDSSLFSKALESNDAALAHRIFDEMAITPIYICRPWFTALFAEAFPPDFLLRVWDVFLFEGVAFLFRVGLAIISSCRQLLLQCKSQEQLLALLAHPPSYCLPSTPDAFIDLAFTVKLRDDDIYKQRQKLEAQLKRQIQGRPQLSTSRVSTPTISLPRS